MLTANHFSEVTLTIAGEGIGIFTFDLIGPQYALFGTEIQPTLDTLCRIYYLHIIIGAIFLFIALTHGISIHSDHEGDVYNKHGVKVQII